MLRTLAVTVALTLAAGLSVRTQTVRTPVAPAPLAGPADMMKLQTAMIAAQQAAIRPGGQGAPPLMNQRMWLRSSVSSPDACWRRASSHIR